ncbi:hypothetical protein V8E36_006177 [Tilletia maclaganii]
MEVDLVNAGAAKLEDGALAFSLLQVVSEARNEHGLRHHDYKAYREYCSKKVHRLRRVERITHADDKHAPAASASNAKANKSISTAGKRSKGTAARKTRQTPASQAAAARAQGPNTFTPQVIHAQNVTNGRPALLLLFEAERAWAHSQEYRNASFENDEDTKLRKLGLGRLRRAVSWADDLVALLKALPEAAVDAQLVAEAVAYRTTLEGFRLFDRGTETSQDAALDQFAVARVLLNTIATHSPTSRREAVTYTFVDQGEAPLRFCAYQLGLSSDSSDLDAIVEQRATSEVCERIVPGYEAVVTRLKQASELHLRSGGEQKRSIKVEWHGRELPIRNPDLLEAIAKVQAEQEHLAQVLNAAEARAAEPTEETPKGDTKAFQKLTHAQRRARRQAAGATAGVPRGSSQPGTRLSSAQFDPYDRPLVALGEAEEVSRQLIAETEDALSKSHTTRYETASADLRLVRDYIQYQLMGLRVARAEHLINALQARAARQDAQAQAVADSKLAALQGKSSSPSATRNAANKKQKPKRVSATKKELKKRPNVRRKAKLGKSSTRQAKKSSPAAQRKRTPARSGTRALLSRQRAADARDLKNSILEDARRRTIQGVPGLARLYDSAEASVAVIATLGLVESDPEISSLVDAKAAWYRAEMLRAIARAYALSGSYAQALLLLTRAGLFVRQARQSLSLITLDDSDTGSVKANKDFPPFIDTAALNTQEESVSTLMQQTRREMFLGQHKVVIAGSSSAYAASHSRTAGGGGVATDASRLGVALRDLATKYVDFDDTVDLQQATVLPEDVQAELEDELDRITASARGAQTAHKPVYPDTRGTGQPSAIQPTGAASVDAKEAQVDGTAPHTDSTASGPYDPGNADDDEAEVQPAQQSRGWLGGWFGRK